ncbi:MAG TPA: hypothetical protein PLG87_02025 [Treponemataceae bacterium]|nr:hypothetical protein [Treponemataceae bacterium]
MNSKTCGKLVKKYVVLVFTSCYAGIMKSSLFLLVVFTILCIAVTLFCAFGYVLVDGCTHMAAGTSLSFFSLDVFLNGIIMCFPFAAGFSCMGMIFYMIRHPSAPLLSVAVYFVIGVAVWAFLVPQALRIEQMGLFKSLNVRTENRLTEGYFRPSEYGVFYYSKINSQNIAEGVYIDTTGASGSMSPISRFTNLQLAPTGNEFFADPLFASSAKITVIIEHIITFAKVMRIEALKAVKKGFFSYLSFASIGLALLSLIGIKSMSSWKLLNLSFVIILYVVICRINLLIYTSPVFYSVLSFFQEKKISVLSSLPYLQLAVNCLISLLLVSAGMIQYLVLRAGERRKSEV